MASFSGKPDLLSFRGAKLMQGLDEKNPKRGYVCIPLDLNEIKLQENQQTHKQMACCRVNIYPFGESYKDAIRRKAMERGDNPDRINVPTHEMSLSYSVEYIREVVKKFPALVQQVIDANKERRPEIVNQDPADENSALFKMIRSRMNSRIASLYQIVSRQNDAQVQMQVQYGVASGVQTYQASSTDDPFDPNWQPDDLPF